MKKIIIRTTAILLILLPSSIGADTADERLQDLLRLAEKAPPEEAPSGTLFSRGDVIFCRGGGEAAEANNSAAAMMENGDFNSAEKVLAGALKHAPLFFPFRYNMGICCIYMNRLDKALLHMEKARGVFPEYHKTYIQIGYIYQRRHKEDTAIFHYRKALEKNPRAHEVFVLIGDVYLGRNQYETGEKYYTAAIAINPKNPNALLGQAKINFFRREYYRAYIIIKYIPLNGEYDKSLHYYYAESAYKLQDYKTAYDQYNTLLTFKNDKFFLSNSTALIQHRIDLCKRFIEIQENY